MLGRYEIVKEILGSPNLKKSEKPWSNSSVGRGSCQYAKVAGLILGQGNTRIN